MSSDQQHNRAQDSGEWLKRSWDDWDAGVPSESVWEELEASIVSEKLWTRLNASLEAEEHTPDNWMVASHTDWEPSASTDIWERLNESISLEQVWQGLDQSLNRRAAARTSYWKLAVASIVALLISTHFTDTPVGNVQISDDTVISFVDSPLPKAKSSDFTHSPAHGVANHPDPSSRNTAVLQPVNPVNDHVAQPTVREIRTLRSPQYALVSSARNGFYANRLTVSEDFSLPALAFRTAVLTDGRNTAPTAPTIHGVERPMPFNHWSAQVGTQLSVLQERDQELLTSTLPRFGLAADMSYRHRAGSFQFMHSIGVSQYTQEAGKYVNGRHIVANQQVNAAQFHTSVGYTYKRVTLYGGLLVSKMLSGLEQNENAVTKVYDFGRAQLGLSAGLDTRIFTFPRSGNQVSFGAQYQWIPATDGVKSSFENIHGLRLQTKFSF